MPAAKNVLWIMADQLRWDYLSCYGHPHLHTPHIDALAAKGVRFDAAFVQSPFCGPSRMSYYTGRYCRSHGATWNGFPLARRRADARRPPAPARRARGAGRQDPHDPRHQGHGVARHRSALADRRAAVGMRLRAVRARRRPASRTGPTIPIRLTTITCASTASSAATRGRNGPTRRKATTAKSSPAGSCATAICRRACPTSIPRRPT